jgi:hypothetical protein
MYIYIYTRVSSFLRVGRFFTWTTIYIAFQQPNCLHLSLPHCCSSPSRGFWSPWRWRGCSSSRCCCSSPRLRWSPYSLTAYFPTSWPHPWWWRGCSSSRCCCSSPRLRWSSYSLTVCFPSSWPHPPAPVLVLSSPLHPLVFLPCLHGGKVDLSGYLYGEVFLSYEIFYGRCLSTTNYTMEVWPHWRQAPPWWLGSFTSKRNRIYTLRWVIL